MNRAVIWRYVLVSDDGLAPHIGKGKCSLAVCKPMIRRHAQPGEWVIGFAKAAECKGYPLVKYVMQITESELFKDYCKTWAGKRRDAIYCYDDDANGVWLDNGYRDHDPSEGDLGYRDKGGKCVLISNNFVHFGDKPRNLMFELMPICNRIGFDAEEIADELWHKNIGQSKYCSKNAYDVFNEWVSELTLNKAAPPHHPPFPKGCAPPTASGVCR